jgi:hypothetical protein
MTFIGHEIRLESIDYRKRLDLCWLLPLKWLRSACMLLFAAVARRRIDEIACLVFGLDSLLRRAVQTPYEVEHVEWCGCFPCRGTEQLPRMKSFAFPSHGYCLAAHCP